MTRLTTVFTTTFLMLAGTVALCADKPSEWDGPPPRDTRGPAKDARGPRDQANQGPSDRRAPPAADWDKPDGHRDSHSRRRPESRRPR